LSSLKAALYRMRGRYRDLLRAEIAETVSDPEEVDLEIRHLFDALQVKCAGGWQRASSLEQEP